MLQYTLKDLTEDAGTYTGPANKADCGTPGRPNTTPNGTDTSVPGTSTSTMGTIGSSVR